MLVLLVLSCSAAMIALAVCVIGVANGRVRAIVAVTLLATAICFVDYKRQTSLSPWKEVEAATLVVAASWAVVWMVPPAGWLVRLLSAHGVFNAMMVLGALSVVALAVGRHEGYALASVLGDYAIVLASALVAIAAGRSGVALTMCFVSAASAFVVVVVLGADKGVVLVAAIVVALLLSLSRVAHGRSLFACVVAASTAGTYLLLTSRSGEHVDALEEYADRRVIAVHELDNPRVAHLFGVISDGSRLWLWEISLQESANSVWCGAPLGFMRDQFGHDEHSAVLFVLNRAGIVGLVWVVAALVLIRGARVFVGPEYNADRNRRRVSWLILWVPISVYWLWGDRLKGPEWLLVLFAVTYIHRCVVAGPTLCAEFVGANEIGSLHRFPGLPMRRTTSQHVTP